jgi:hypothetical protein
VCFWSDEERCALRLEARHRVKPNEMHRMVYAKLSEPHTARQ